MKKLLIIPILFIASLLIAQERTVELRHNDGQLVYSQNEIYYLNKETEPLTAIIKTIGRWSKLVEQLTAYNNGIKIYTEEYDEGVIRYREEYEDGEVIKKAYYQNGQVARIKEY